MHQYILIFIYKDNRSTSQLGWKSNTCVPCSRQRSTMVIQPCLFGNKALFLESGLTERLKQRTEAEMRCEWNVYEVLPSPRGWIANIPPHTHTHTHCSFSLSSSSLLFFFFHVLLLCSLSFSASQMESRAELSLSLGNGKLPFQLLTTANVNV